MSRRKSIDLRGFAHRNPIPAACRLGPLLMSGSILPRRADGTSPATLDEQCALMFQYVREILEHAGGTTEHIVKVDVAMKDASEREVLNKHWVEMFPDSSSRPARHTETKDLPGNILVQCEIVAMIGD
jgi:2-iminobutanoate/2-iminopropanoate deaminase